MQNLNITGKLIINTPGAHIDVKTSTTIGGATSIQDVRGSSFVSNGTHTGGILVTDSNNSRISLSDKASNAVVIIDTSGNVSLAGTFNTNINIVKAAKISVEEEAIVASLTVAPSASGTTIANAGIITEVVAPPDVQFTGNQPLKVTPVGGGNNNGIININLNGVLPMDLAGVSIENDYLINHIGYNVKIQSNIDNRVKYIYIGDFEESQKDKLIHAGLNGLINRDKNSGSFSRGIQSNENVLSVDRYIMILYLDKDMNPIGYKEEMKTLHKTSVKKSDDISELSEDEVSKYIYIDEEENLQFNGTEYFEKNNSAKFISVHFSTKDLNIEDVFKRKNEPHEAARLNENPHHYYSKSNILSLLELENSPISPFNTMIVIYDEKFNVIGYGNKTVSM